MNKLKTIAQLLLTKVIYFYSKIRFHNIWSYKQFLFDRKEKNFLFKQNYIDAFQQRCYHSGGSWIGYDAIVKGLPVFPHGISGLFISGGGYNWL